MPENKENITALEIRFKLFIDGIVLDYILGNSNDVLTFTGLYSVIDLEKNAMYDMWAADFINENKVDLKDEINEFYRKHIDELSKITTDISYRKKIAKVVEEKVPESLEFLDTLNYYSAVRYFSARLFSNLLDLLHP